ncbi:MAG: hypothetical protein ACKOAR_15355 [Bacteroidota bacterium]
MKISVRILILVALIAMIAPSGYAQRFDSVFRSMPYFDKYYGFAGVASIPVSNRSFLGNPSVKGGRFMYREMLNDRVSAGLDITFAGYDDYTPPRLYQNDNSAVYTDFYNNVNQFGISVSGEYLFRPEGKVIPFAGAGLGASYTSVRVYYNVYDNRESKWSVLIRPYAGAMIRFGTKTSWGAFASANLDYSTLKMPNYDYQGFATLSFQAGLVYLNW